MSICTTCLGIGCDACLDRTQRTTPCHPDCRHHVCRSLTPAARHGADAAETARVTADTARVVTATAPVGVPTPERPGSGRAAGESTTEGSR